MVNKKHKKEKIETPEMKDFKIYYKIKGINREFCMPFKSYTKEYIKQQFERLFKDCEVIKIE